MKNNFGLPFIFLIGILIVNVVYAVPIAPNQANITAKVLDVDRLERPGYDASKFRLKILDSQNVADYLNFAKVNETIEVIVYHKNVADLSSILEIERGDTIKGIIFKRGSEHGTSWQANDIQVVEKSASGVDKRESAVVKNENYILYITAGISSILILAIILLGLKKVARR